MKTLTFKILRYDFSLSDCHFSLIFLEGEVPTARAQLEPCISAHVLPKTYVNADGLKL